MPSARKTRRPRKRFGADTTAIRADTPQVAEYDNTLFWAITHNLALLHLDEEYSKTAIYGSLITNSMTCR